MFLSGSVGIEMIEGIFDPETFSYGVLVHAEEFLEMTGAILFIWGLLGYIRDTFGEVRIPMANGRMSTAQTHLDLTPDLVG